MRAVQETVLRCFLALWVALAPVKVWAGSMTLLGVGGASVAYVGPGDITTFKLFYSLRCYSAAFSGAIADITDTATGNTTQTRLQCSNGVVSALVSSSACTLVTGNACSPLATTCAVACSLNKLYDQLGSVNCTGSCDLFAVSNAARLDLILNCVNSLPCWQSTGNTQLLQASGATFTANDPNSFSVVSNFATGTGNPQFAVFPGNGSTHSAFFNSTTQLGIFAGSTATAATAVTTATWYSIQGQWQGGAACGLWVNGTANTGLNCGGTITNINSPGFIGANRAGFTGTLRQTEIGLINATASGTVSSLTSNQRAYWGF